MIKPGLCLFGALAIAFALSPSGASAQQTPTSRTDLPTGGLPSTPPNPVGSADINQPAAGSEKAPGAPLLGPSAETAHAANTTDRRFIEAALENGAAQLEAAQLAAKTSKNTKVTLYSRTVIADQPSADTRLIAIAKGAGLAAPRSRAKADDELHRLETVKDATFDGLYGQIAVADAGADMHLYQEEAQSGENAELKDFAKLRLQRLGPRLKSAEQLAQGTVDAGDARCPPNSPAKAGCP